jgi:hypothetical protein
MTSPVVEDYEGNDYFSKHIQIRADNPMIHSANISTIESAEKRLTQHGFPLDAIPHHNDTIAWTELRSLVKLTFAEFATLRKRAMDEAKSAYQQSPPKKKSQNVITDFIPPTTFRGIQAESLRDVYLKSPDMQSKANSYTDFVDSPTVTYSHVKQRALLTGKTLSQKTLSMSENPSQLVGKPIKLRKTQLAVSKAALRAALSEITALKIQHFTNSTSTSKTPSGYDTEAELEKYCDDFKVTLVPHILNQYRLKEEYKENIKRLNDTSSLDNEEGIIGLVEQALERALISQSAQISAVFIQFDCKVMIDELLILLL